MSPLIAQHKACPSHANVYHILWWGEWGWSIQGNHVGISLICSTMPLKSIPLNYLSESGSGYPAIELRGTAILKNGLHRYPGCSNTVQYCNDLYTRAHNVARKQGMTRASFAVNKNGCYCKKCARRPPPAGSTGSIVRP